MMKTEQSKEEGRKVHAFMTASINPYDRESGFMPRVNQTGEKSKYDDEIKFDDIQEVSLG